MAVFKKKDNGRIRTTERREQAHNGGKKRKRDFGASVDLSIDLNDYDRCMEFVNE